MIVLRILGLALLGTVVAMAEPVMIGAAKVDVTPTEPVVLAGYGGRSTPYEGIDNRLWARAMVLGEIDPVAVVVLDNCGVPEAIVARLAQRLTKHGITRDRLVVAATHTHNAPNLVGYAPILWAGRTKPEWDKASAAYTDFAIAQMEAAVLQAMENSEPMMLVWAQGRATFGGNRRVMVNGIWRGFGFQRGAPVDHSLPVLGARNLRGEVKAVWANYACHCTTVGSRNHVGGDWAGFANEKMEAEFPDAVSLMTIGCGADIGPQPGGGLPDATAHGAHIAREVRRLLSGEGSSLSHAPVARSKRVDLPLVEPKPREHWQAQARGSGFDAQLAKAMLKELDAKGRIASHVDYPISAWTFGDDLAMVFLGGEVVVDYSLRLNRELDWSRLWITGWANSMPGYIPSKRVLKEGGYEADFSQVYYQLPGRYQPEVEDIVVDAVHELIGERFGAKADQKPAPFHRAPSGDELTMKRVATWAKTADKALLAQLRGWVRIAQPAIGEAGVKGGEQTEWHNFAGDFVHRRFIRQTGVGNALQWRSPGGGSQVLGFTGGTGWESEPGTAGFELKIGDRPAVVFDVTREPKAWSSEDRTIKLAYLPSWTSAVDSGGFFFLHLVAPGPDPVNIRVRSLGDGSQRWFAVDTEQRFTERLGKLRAALGE